MSVVSTVKTRMSIEQEAGSASSFVRARLPWVIAAAALLGYIVTMSHWVSSTNLMTVARLSGWTWQPNLSEPLYWLMTYPLHWLPAKNIPIALNLLAVVCAALTLALLARSVALLPHDRTLEQRQREHEEFAFLSIRASWLPPLMAVLVCGLQLTFWENATSGSVEILNLLIFAYVIRCLLEFRVDERESWLAKAAFVYGLGITNNWAMIGFLPLFVAALVWIRGLNFFNLQFLGTMFVCGLAGLLLYLLLPVVQSRADILTVPFWQGLKTNIGTQFGIVLALYKSSRPTIALLSLTSILPVIIIGIKWASYFGDTSRIGIIVATLTFHIAHAILLVACIWVAMDPPFSARHIGMGKPFLTFYYLGALSVGYFAGYFLLIFGRKTVRPRRTPGYVNFINSAVTVCIWALFLLAPVVLVARNLPQIRMSNGALFSRIANQMTESLPGKGTIVLSDDLRRLLLAQAALAQKGEDKSFIFVDSGTFSDHLVLEYPDYHRYLRKVYGSRWPIDLANRRNFFVPPGVMLQLFGALEQSNRLFYLHPSFGSYFERFYLVPHGLTCEFKSYTTTNPFPPALSEELVTENESFWTKADSDSLQPILSALSVANKKRNPSLLDRFTQMAHLENEPNRDALTMATFYSRGLNYWGVELQKKGELEKASRHFQRALDLNEHNVAAEVNLQCNANLKAGRPAAVQLSKSVTESFGPYRNWNTVITENGPFDEPSFCYEHGQFFIQAKLFRQAMLQFERVRELDPAHLSARLWLAQLYILIHRPDDALKLVSEIHEHKDLFPISRTNVNELMFAEASAHLAKKDVAAADAIVAETLNNFAADKDLLPNLLTTASQMYLNFGFFSNAVPFIDRQLSFAPYNVSALINKGYASLQLREFDQAIPPLTRVLQLQTNNYSALLNRAIAYLRSGQLDSAQRDYQTLQKAAPSAYPVFYGLGEIAYQQKDTNSAIHNYELYLSSGSPNSEETEFVKKRLAELKPH